MQSTFAAIGRAVVSAQLFEVALIPIFEAYKMHVDPAYLEKTGGYVSAGAFKVPVKNIVKMLAEKGDISSDLEASLNTYIENRHTLIHRWVIENGIPDDLEHENSNLKNLADAVAIQANLLTRQIVGYVVKYGNPDWAEENRTEFEERMLNIFNQTRGTNSEP